jgi:zeaxanthin glucosyltransferase
MKTALFIMLPVISHYNACFGLAASLREQGDRVVFTGTPDLRDHVEREGFEFASMRYMEEYFIPNARVALGLFVKSRVDKIFLFRRYREFWNSVLAFKHVHVAIAPDTVYLDEHLNHYYFLLESTERNVVLLNTKLPTRRAAGIPPLTCTVPFRQNGYYRVYADLLWNLFSLRRNLLSKLQTIVLNGRDDSFFLSRCATRNGLDYDRQLRRENALYVSIKNVEIIHLCPRLLEYDWYKLSEGERLAYYPYHRKSTPMPGQTALWNDLLQLIEDQKRQGRFILYASLGTLSDLNAQAGIGFLHRLIESIGKMADTYLIISAGRLARFLNEGLPVNVSLYEGVPQPELLAHCDLMITHGGMNSICDCLTAGVPMLVYPLNLKSDQPGNAAHIVAKGWGLTGNLRRDSILEIGSKVQQLVMDRAMLQRVKSCRLVSFTDEYPTMDLAESR